MQTPARPIIWTITGAASEPRGHIWPAEKALPAEITMGFFSLFPNLEEEQVQLCSLHPVSCILNEPASPKE